MAESESQTKRGLNPYEEEEAKKKKKKKDKIQQYN